MSLFTPMLTFPAVILPGFICAALLLAVLLRHRSAEIPWRCQDLLAAFCVVLLLFGARQTAGGLPPPHEPPPGATLEVDMLASSGTFVELWLNDWQHPSERLSVVAGARHVYRFKNLPRDITLVRLDPSEQTGAKIVIYSVALKSGGRTLRQFGPADLKNWTLSNVSPPQDDNGGLSLVATNGDPILWTRLNSPLTVAPPIQPPSAPSWRQWLNFYSPLLLAAAACLLFLLVRIFPTRPLAALLNHPIPSSSWIVWLVALLAASATLYAQAKSAGSDIGVEVDMRVSRGHSIELWINDWQHDPERLPVIEGERRVYRFGRMPQHLTLMRLDPTDLPGAKVVIFGIAVKTRDQTFRQFDAADLKKWTFNNFSPPRDEDGGLALDDTNDDPSLWTTLDLRLPGSALLSALSSLVETSDGPFLLVITTFLLVLLAGMTARTGRIQAVLIAASAGAAKPLVLSIMNLHLSPPAVTSVVGYAAYHGYAKKVEHLSALVLLLTCVALGYAFAKLAGHGKSDGDALPLDPRAPNDRRRIVWITHSAVFVLLLVYFLPDVHGLMVSFRALDLSSAHGTNLETVESLGQIKQQHVQWDAANVLTWTYMLNTGLRPMRDFWFPYTGWYLQLQPFPTGPVTIMLHCAVLLWILYWCLYRISGRCLGQALAIFGLILAPVLAGMASGWDRYLTAVDVALFYVVICETRLDWRTHGPFAAVVAYAFFFEPTQVVYAGAGIAAHTGVAVFSRFQGNTFRQRLRESARALQEHLIRAGTPLLAGITAALLLFTSNGMLAGLWDFEKSIGDQGDYGAVPSDIVKWVLPQLQPESVFLLVFLLTSYAVYRSVTRACGRPDPLETALLVLCGVAFVTMQKQVLRPHVMTQVRIYPYVAALLFGLIAWRKRQPAARIVMAAFAGCILGIAIHRGEFREIVHQDLETGPGKISRTVHALLNPKEFADANSRLYARANLTGFQEENAVLDSLVQSSELRAGDTVYVLGDDSIFYILLNQQPPYDINSYNESPIYEQQRVLDWFHRKNPRFVIWDPQDSTFDGVPHNVRLPLIYGYVVAHYDFLRAVGPYQILTERQPNQPPNLEFWRRTLGDPLDLGHIPGRARLSEYAACTGDTANCDPVLVVRYPLPLPVPRGKLTVDVDSFKLQFDVTPGEREYVINLHRLWFWSLLSEPKIAVEDRSAETQTTYRTEPHPILY